MELINENIISENNQDIQSLTSIYRQISVSINDHFDETEEKDIVYEAIDKCFDTEFKQISLQLLQDDFNLINNKFVCLVKHTNQMHSFKKMNIIFVYFCDYFDMDYSKTFQLLHPKIQDIIKSFYKKSIGNKEYRYQQQKYSEKKDFTQKTLFDLFP